MAQMVDWSRIAQGLPQLNQMNGPNQPMQSMPPRASPGATWQMGMPPGMGGPVPARMPPMQNPGFNPNPGPGQWRSPVTPAPGGMPMPLGQTAMPGMGDVSVGGGGWDAINGGNPVASPGGSMGTGSMWGGPAQQGGMGGDWMSRIRQLLGGMGQTSQPGGMLGGATGGGGGGQISTLPYRIPPGQMGQFGMGGGQPGMAYAGGSPGFNENRGAWGGGAMAQAPQLGGSTFGGNPGGMGATLQQILSRARPI